jgi:hypothetical protein
LKGHPQWLLVEADLQRQPKTSIKTVKSFFELKEAIFTNTLKSITTGFEGFG